MRAEDFGINIDKLSIVTDDAGKFKPLSHAAVSYRELKGRGWKSYDNCCRQGPLYKRLEALWMGSEARSRDASRKPKRYWVIGTGSSRD